MKCELRQEKGGGYDLGKCLAQAPTNDAAGGTTELAELLDKSFAIMKDEDAGSSRFLQCARRCGWLSHQADPQTGRPVRSDSSACAQHFEERSAGRTPRDWWAIGGLSGIS